MASGQKTFDREKKMYIFNRKKELLAVTCESRSIDFLFDRVRSAMADFNIPISHNQIRVNYYSMDGRITDDITISTKNINKAINRRKKNMNAKIKYKIKTVKGWITASIPCTKKIESNNLIMTIRKKLQDMHPNCEIQVFYIENLTDEVV